jgi:hypothetical protein
MQSARRGSTCQLPPSPDTPWEVQSGKPITSEAHTVAELKTTPVKKQEPTRIKVRSVVGLMIHPFTLDNITEVPMEVEKDWWIDNQLEAGKLTHVTA